MSIHSKLMTLKEIVESNYYFQVPIYQRLYVWGDDEVKTLLADLLTAFRENKDIYYLGGALVVEKKREDGSICFDLIDGQQRFTTLWMMGFEWGNALQPFLHGNECRPRISFPIREKVDEYFHKRIKGESTTIENAQIIDAFARISGFPNEDVREIDMKKFTTFIYENVKMVFTHVPSNMDLNKLFEVINNRGVQLQHHEILKARLLHYINDSGKRELYSHLWDACSYMGGFVEKNLKGIVKKFKIAQLFDDTGSAGDNERLANVNEVLQELAKCQSGAGGETEMSLESILSEDFSGIKPGEDEGDAEDYEADEVRSIITFPMLLQHVLRIWLCKPKSAGLERDALPDLPKILDRELLYLFENHFLNMDITEKDVTSFIGLLWEIRYLFDKHIIKWVNTGEEEVHLINKLRVKRTRRYQSEYVNLYRERLETPGGFALLQSMLYHSQQITTHYWLTPLLAYMHSSPGAQDTYFTFLRHLDNHLFSSTESEDLIIRTRKFMETPWRECQLDCSILGSDSGIEFAHYWFYKLEFVLWDMKRKEMGDLRWYSFRLTAKNSVEHISPQLPQKTDTNTVSYMLNRFGNLALISRSINSEYGNKPFNEKRRRFLNKNIKELDSLKMELVYKNEIWNDDIAFSHEREMIDLLESYLNTDFHRGTDV